MSRHKKDRREARNAVVETVGAPDRSPEEMQAIMDRRKAAILEGVTREASLRGQSMALGYQMAALQR